MGLTAVCLYTLSMRPLQIQFRCCLKKPFTSSFCPPVYSDELTPSLVLCQLLSEIPRNRGFIVVLSASPWSALSAPTTLSQFSAHWPISIVWQKDGNRSNNWLLNIMQLSRSFNYMPMVKEARQPIQSVCIQHGCEYRLTHTKLLALGLFF